MTEIRMCNCGHCADCNDASYIEEVEKVRMKRMCSLPDAAKIVTARRDIRYIAELFERGSIDQKIDWLLRRELLKVTKFLEEI